MLGNGYKIIMKRIIISLFLIGYGTVPLFAQSQTWKIDPAHSNIQFSVKHMVITEVVGQFKEYDATLIISKADFSDAKLDVTINTHSVDTGFDDRDHHLISDEFFDTEKFPKMSFKSKSVVPIDEKNFNIIGELTLLGVSKTVVFKTSYGGMIVDPYGNTRSGWQALTTINRFDFGMKWNKVLDTGGFIVGEEINIKIDAQFILQK